MAGVTIKEVKPGQYMADMDLTPMSLGYDLRAHPEIEIAMMHAKSVAFCIIENSETIVLAEGETSTLAHLLRKHGFKVQDG